MLKSNTAQSVVFACSCVVCCQGARPLLHVRQRTPLPEIFLSSLHSLCNKRNEPDSGTQLVSPVKVEKCFCVNSSWCNNMTASHADRFRQVHRGCDAIHQLLQGLHSFLPALHLNSSTRPETSTELNCHTPIHCTWPSILLIRSSPTHPCRQTAPLSWSTARWAGCSSPPCPPAEPYHR